MAYSIICLYACIFKYIEFLAIAHIRFDMKIVACKINSTHRFNITYNIFGITGHLFSEIGIKSNLAATHLLQLIWKLCGIGKGLTMPPE